MIARSYCDETLPNSRRQTVRDYGKHAFIDDHSTMNRNVLVALRYLHTELYHMQKNEMFAKIEK